MVNDVSCFSCIVVVGVVWLCSEVDVVIVFVYVCVYGFFVLVVGVKYLMGG